MKEPFDVPELYLLAGIVMALLHKGENIQAHDELEALTSDERGDIRWAANALVSFCDDISAEKHSFVGDLRRRLEQSRHAE